MLESLGQSDKAANPNFIKKVFLQQIEKVKAMFGNQKNIRLYLNRGSRLLFIQLAIEKLWTKDRAELHWNHDRLVARSN